MSQGISNRKNSLPVDKNKAFRCETHDDYWSSWFFWHRRYGRMLIDPVLCDLLEPWTQLNPCNISYPSTASSPYVLGCV